MTSGGQRAACSFCGKEPSEVGHLVVGPGVWICDGCVRVRYGITEGLDQGGRSGGDAQHLAKAGQAEPDLPAEGYGELVRSGIAALHGRLGE